MGSDGAVGAAVWIATAIIVVSYIWIGGINIGTIIVTIILMGVAFITTASLKPSRPPWIEMRKAEDVKTITDKLEKMMSELESLKKEVAEIRKVLQE